MSKLLKMKSVKLNPVKVKTNQLKKKAKLARKVISDQNKGVGSVPKQKKAWRKPRGGKGVVYLSHIPHGFYEDQIEAYFKQFGKITAVSVPRSKTGKSKGYAFVEFAHPEVAKIAADTMNNYLMLNRLIKAKYIPPAEQKPKYFITAEMARKSHSTAPEKAKLQMENNRKVKNRKLKISLEAEVACKLVRKKKALKNKLEKLGLDYDFEVEDGGIESIIKIKKEQQVKQKEKLEKKKEKLENFKEQLKQKKESMKALSNENSSLEINEELQSSEENKLPEINTSISAKKEKSQKNEIKQKIGKHSLNSLQNVNDVQENLNKTKSPIEEKSKKHNKNSTTPLKNTCATRLSQSEAVVMEVDENDEEISFKTPPNVLKKAVNPKVSGSNVTPKNRKKAHIKATPRKGSKFPLNASSSEQN